MFGICNLSVVPCRAQPFDKSEMVTQLLFGEHFKILSEEEKWVLIKIAFDEYECWIDKKQFKKISEEEYKQLDNGLHHGVLETVKKIGRVEQAEKILMGSTLPVFRKGKFTIGEENFSFRGKTVPLKKKSNRNKIVSTAKLYLNSPYLWGGRSPFGIDCSGFTQMVFKLNGIRLPRDAWQQASRGEALNFIEEAQKGDLAFFDNAEGKIIHVGIILSNSHTLSLSKKNREKTRKIDEESLENLSRVEKLEGTRIIHSSGKVRIDTLDHYGIFNAETGKYSHNLRLIKSIF